MPIKDSNFHHPRAAGETQVTTTIPKHGSPPATTPQPGYLLQRDSLGRPIGHLDHGPVMPDGTLHIEHADLRTDLAVSHTARRVIHRLLDFARQHHAKTILLAQPSNPQQVAFWRGCGFEPRAIAPGTEHSATPLVQYEYIFAERA